MWVIFIFVKLTYFLNMINKKKNAICWLMLFICLPFVYSQERTDDANKIKITTREFLEDPFGFQPTIENFSDMLHKRIRIKKYTFKNKRGYSKLDTIYKFFKGRSVLFIDKPYKMEQSFFAGTIKNKKIKLNHGIQIGMEKDLFIDMFADIDNTPRDTIKLSDNNITNNYTFVFKNSKLHCIKIDNKRQ